MLGEVDNTVSNLNDGDDACSQTQDFGHNGGHGCGSVIDDVLHKIKWKPKFFSCGLLLPFCATTGFSCDWLFRPPLRTSEESSAVPLPKVPS